MAEVVLSKNDSAILGALFDPEASSNNHSNIDHSKVFSVYDRGNQQIIEQRERDALLSINIENPSEEDIKMAVSELTIIIASYPKYASAYNNRAQARRMLADDAQIVESGVILEDILADLDQAIILASPSLPTDSVSPKQAQILASSYTHRGFLLWKVSRAEKIPDVFPGIDKDQLEEMASKDFAIGGRYGNKTAQTLAVKTNPYAKLCGSIVREALKKEVEEYNAGMGSSMS